jgi:serine/threonine-protein kinase RsbW
MKEKIPNNLESIYRIEGEVIRGMALLGYDENEQFAVRLALDEALINAFRHGNQGEAHRHIHVEADMTSEEITIAVEDEGTGFDPACLNDPRHEDHVRRTSGRGVFLIREFMTETRFRKNGARVEFRFARGNIRGAEPYGLVQWIDNDTAVIEISPRRIAQTPLVILDSISRLLEEGAKWIVFDMRQMEQVDSAVLGFLVSATRETESQGGELGLIRPRPEVERIIEATCLDSILRTYGDIELALRAFEQKMKKTA